MKVLDWLADMLGLPSHFKFSESAHGGGVIHGTASEATLVALLVARSRALNKLKKQQGLDLNNNNEEDELSVSLPQVNPRSSSSSSASIDRLVGYCSDLAHSSVERAGLLGGVNIKAVQSDDDCRMRGFELRRRIIEDQEAGLVPFIVVATLGTTSVCTYDDLYEIGQVCRELDIWLHVDAAYAGNSFVCPENRKFMRGIEVGTSDESESLEFKPPHTDWPLIFIVPLC